MWVTLLVVAVLISSLFLTWLGRTFRRPTANFWRLLLKLASRPLFAPREWVVPSAPIVSCHVEPHRHQDTLCVLGGGGNALAARSLLVPIATFRHLIDVMLMTVPRRHAAFGALHVSNRLVLHRNWFLERAAQSTHLATIYPLSSHPTRSGRAYSFAVSIPDHVESRGTFLFFGGGGSKNAPPPPPLTDAPWDELLRDGHNGPQLSFKEHEGRDMARVSADVNPIHLHRWLAFLFGFNGGVVAPGMLVQLKLLSQLQLPEPPLTIACSFRKPVFMPGTVDTWIAPRPDGKGIIFEVRHSKGAMLQAGWIAAGEHLESNPF